MTGATPTHDTHPGSITLPIPARVGATYIVAAPERLPADPPAQVAECLTALPIAPGRAPVRVIVEEITSDDPRLAWAEEILCCPDCSPGAERLLGALMGCSREHYAVTCTAPTGWPPVHLWAAARAVDTLAELTGGIRLDPDVPRLLPVPWRPVPATGPETFVAGDWLWPSIGLEERGHTLLTTGMTRFGLPELGADGLDADQVHPGIRLLDRLARSLIRRLFTHLAANPADTVLTLPAELPISGSDGPPTVRLRHDRAALRGGTDLLTVLIGPAPPHGPAS